MTKLNLSSEAFFTKLKNDINGKSGKIEFTLNNINVKINTKDTIGHMLQEWIQLWATQQNIYLRANQHTQEFPDFFLSNSNTEQLLEIKSFDNDASANFDLANFDTFVRSVQDQPNKLYADYIIIAYTMNDSVLTIKNIWLKKIWELCTNMKNRPLRVQVKQDIIHNIRPATFNSANINRLKYKPFTTLDQFLTATQELLDLYPKTSSTHKMWMTEVNKKLNKP